MNIKPEKIEYYIVKMMLESDLFIRTYANKMAPEMFSNDLKTIIIGILAFYKKTNKTVKVNILEDLIIPKICKDKDYEVEIAKEQLQKVLALDSDSNDLFTSLKEDIENFIKTRKFILAWAKASPLLDEQKHDEARTIIEDAFKVTFDESMGLDYWEDLEKRSARSNDIKETMTTSLPTLDKYIGGGYRRKALFVFAGPPNVGKSLVLNDAASSLSLNGFNVLYLSLELSEDYISQRTDAKIGNCSMNSINLSPEDAIKTVIAKRNILKKNNKKIGKLIYKDYSPNSISCNDIKCFIKNWELKNDLKFDFIVVDYLKLIKANGKVYGDNLYNKLGTVCEELRDIARTFNVCVISASQTDRQSMNSDSIKMSNISDSIAIVQTADVLVTLARDETLNAQNLMLVSVVKSRFSKNNSQFTARIDYDYMRLIDMGDGTSVDKNKHSTPSNTQSNTNRAQPDDFDDEPKDDLKLF